MLAQWPEKGCVNAQYRLPQIIGEVANANQLGAHGIITDTTVVHDG
jgi:hypothetical protein